MICNCDDCLRERMDETMQGYFQREQQMKEEIYLRNQKSDRRMFIECGLMLFAMAAFLGFWGFHILQEASKPHPNSPYLTEADYGFSPTTEWDP